MKDNSIFYLRCARWSGCASSGTTWMNTNDERLQATFAEPNHGSGRFIRTSQRRRRTRSAELAVLASDRGNHVEQEGLREVQQRECGCA